VSVYSGPLPTINTQTTVTVNDPECLAADAQVGSLNASGNVDQSQSIPYFTMVLADGTTLVGPPDATGQGTPGVMLILSDEGSAPPSNICAPNYQNQIAVTMGP
jgi:hypothetical protein